MKYLPMLLVVLVALAAPLYNIVEPRLFGVPFFYWLQIVLIPLSSLAILIAYRRDARAR